MEQPADTNRMSRLARAGGASLRAIVVGLPERAATGGHAGDSCVADARAGVEGLPPTRRARSRRAHPVVVRSALTLLVLGIVTSMMSVVTGATLTDRTTMATITTVGGTLDILVNGEADDTAVAYGGTGATITTDVSNMAPGDTAWGEVAIDNAGTLPLTLTVSSIGSDTHPDQTSGHCFSFYFREVGSTGATGNGATLAAPYEFTAMGTDESPDSSTVLFETAVTGRPLPDVGASSDDIWETDDVKTYRLTVRMRTECTQGGEGTAAATGSLDFRFEANQA